MFMYSKLLMSDFLPLSWVYTEDQWTYKDMQAKDQASQRFPNINYQGVSLAEELVRLGYVTRIFQAAM